MRTEIAARFLRILRQHLQTLFPFATHKGYKSQQFLRDLVHYILTISNVHEGNTQEERFGRNPSIASTRSKIIIYQWTLINGLSDDKALHEIAYLERRLSSLSTPADRAIEVVVCRGFFSSEFPWATPSSTLVLHLLLFHLLLYTRTESRSRFLLGHVSFFPLALSISLWSFLEEATTSRGDDVPCSEPLADRGDSDNKDTRGSKHSLWGFRGVVITITTPYATRWKQRTTLCLLPPQFLSPFAVTFLLWPTSTRGFPRPMRAILANR